MYVVINSDDLGLHPAVRRAVVSLYQDGFLSSATLTANGPDFEEASGVQGVGIGVHLNILRGAPLSPPDRISSLVDGEGLLLGDYGKLFARYIAGRISLDEVRLEWSTQIERVIAAGVMPTHLDSEKHVHAWPRLTRLAAELARRYGIKWMRRPVERLRLGLPASGLARIAALQLFATATPRLPGPPSLPDLTWGIAEQGGLLQPQRFFHYVSARRSRPRVIEIVCHPGAVAEGDGPLDPRFGAFKVARNWEAEREALSSPEWKIVLHRLDATLVDYGRIPQ